MHPLLERAQHLTRRQFFGSTGLRLGGAALALLAGRSASAAVAEPTRVHPPLPGFPHFAPKAKAVIYLHMNGGPSQLDTFDYKPGLAAFFDKELPGIIRSYNKSVGGVNSDTEGYHETITRVFLHGVRLFLDEANRREPLHKLVNELLLSPMGRRDWPMRFYSPPYLFSVDARRKFVRPDVAALP